MRNGHNTGVAANVSLCQSMSPSLSLFGCSGSCVFFLQSHGSASFVGTTSQPSLPPQLPCQHPPHFRRHCPTLLSLVSRYFGVGNWIVPTESAFYLVSCFSGVEIWIVPMAESAYSSTHTLWCCRVVCVSKFWVVPGGKCLRQVLPFRNPPQVQFCFAPAHSDEAMMRCHLLNSQSSRGSFV